MDVSKMSPLVKQNKTILLWWFEKVQETEISQSIQQNKHKPNQNKTENSIQPKNAHTKTHQKKPQQRTTTTKTNAYLPPPSFFLVVI